MTKQTVWPVYTGKSFNLWNPDTGTYYDSVEASEIAATLQKKRLAQRNTKASAFSEQATSVANDPQTLPCLRPRIAFRDVTRATDTRTLVVALIPGEVVAVNKAPCLLQVSGDSSDEAFLLGVLSSMILDWQMRRTVELSVTFAQLSDISIPDPGEGHPVRDRVAEVAARLGTATEQFAAWGQEHGAPVGSLREADSAGGGGLRRDQTHWRNSTHVWPGYTASVKTTSESCSTRSTLKERSG